VSKLLGRTRFVLGGGGRTALVVVAFLTLAASCASSPGSLGSGAPSGDALAASALIHSEEEGQLVEYPWGWIRWLMSSEIDPGAPMTFGVVQVEANQDNPFHLHSNCEEYLYVVSGSCEHRIGDEWVALKAGDLVRIPAGVSHRARTREEPMRAVIVYSAGARDFTAVEE
jgi:quercetin dioxygenase-like cupin family protein